MVYAQTYDLDGVGPTDTLGNSNANVKTLTVGCSEGYFEIVFYEQSLDTTDLLYMGNGVSAQISLDGQKPLTVAVKKKQSGDVISIIEPKKYYAKFVHSKSMTIRYKIGATSWVGKFKTSGLGKYSSSFSRYGCAV